MRKEDKSTIIEQIAATVKEYGHELLAMIKYEPAYIVGSIKDEQKKEDMVSIKNLMLYMQILEKIHMEFREGSDQE